MSARKLLGLLVVAAGAAFARAETPLDALIVETERELRGTDPKRFEKIADLIEAGAESTRAEFELARYVRSAPDDVLIHYLPFAIDLGLATPDNYGRVLADLMIQRGPAVRVRAFDLAAQSVALTSPEERETLVDAMAGHLSVEQDDERLISALNVVARCDRRFAGLETRLLDIRVNHQNPRVVSAAAHALYAIRGGGDSLASLTQTLRAFGLDASDRVRKLCEQMLYK